MDRKKVLSVIFFIITVFILFVGGLGNHKAVVPYLGLALSLILLATAYFQSRKLVLPKGSLFFFLVLQVFFLGLLWSLDRESSLLSFISFLAGGVFWISFYNIKRDIADKFLHLILILGVLFSVFFVIRSFAGLPFARVFLGEPNLVFPAAELLKHNHLGDLWAVVTLITSYLIIFEKKYFYLIFVPVEFFILSESLSRSAYLALIFGILYIVYLSGGSTLVSKYKFLLLSVLLFGVFLFLKAAATKDLLLSRPYFVQAIEGIYKHPFGIGMGNFQKISYESMQWKKDPMAMSAFAHNIFLEAASGVGVLVIFFLIWLFVVTRKIFSRESGIRGRLFKAIFLAISINFLFDYTYAIPTMLWLWFMSMGLAQEQGVLGKES